MFFALSAKGADVYWTGGSGKWSDLGNWATTSGGSIRPAAVPGAGDNVFFDAKSFSATGQVVTMDLQNTFCQSLDMTAVTWDVQLQGLATGVLNLFGNLKLSNRVKFTTPGEVIFSATQTDAEIRMAGNTFRSILRFRDNIGSIQLGGSLEVDSLLIFEGGIFRSKGYPIGTKYLDLRLSQARAEVNLDGSLVTVRGAPFLINSNIYNEIPSALIQYQAGKFSGLGSTIDCSANQVLFQVKGVGGLRWGRLVLSSSLGKGRVEVDSVLLGSYQLRSETNTRGVLTMDTLVLAKGRTYRFQEAKNYRLRHLVASGDCANPIQLFSESAGIQTQFLAVSGSISGDYMILRDVRASGGATFTASNSADLGNNSGWTIAPKPDNKRFWVGGTGNWYDPMHWSSTSGGAPGTCIPTAGDDVYFDANSFPPTGGTVSLNVENAYCRSMDWTGSMGNPVFAGSELQFLHLFGSMKLIAAMNWNILGDVLFEGNSSGNNITTATQKFNKDLYFNGSGEWIMQDELEVELDLILVKGSLNTNSKTLTLQNFQSQRDDEAGNPRTLTLGNSRVYLRPKKTPWVNWIMQTTQFTLNAGQSKIFFVGFGSMQLYGNNPLNFNEVQNFGNFQIYSYLGAGRRHNFNQFVSYHDLYVTNRLRFSKWELTGGFQYRISAGDTLYVGELIPVNACDGLVFLGSQTEQLTAYLYLEKNLMVENFLIKDVHAVGPGSATAINSIDLGNAKNWVITNKTARTLYWVGGHGMWSDKNHWSLSSNGPGGQCIPTPLDDVIFDGASFPAANARVTLEDNAAYARNLSIGDVRNNPFFFSAYGSLEVYGNLLLAPRNRCFFSINRLKFKGKQQGNTAVFAGQFIPFVEVDGTGQWTFTDSLSTWELSLRSGTLNSGGKPVSTNFFYATGDKLKTKLEMGSSHWYINGNYNDFWEFSITGDSVTVDAGTSTIEFTNGGDLFERLPHAYNRILFSDKSGSGTFKTETGVGVARSVEFIGNGTLLGKHLIDSLLFSPGKSYRLDADNPQELTRYFQVFGNNCNPIELQSTQAGKKSTVLMNSGEVKGDFIQMRDQLGSGSVRFYAGYRSVNIGNSNTNWIFDSPSYYRDEGFLGPDVVQCTAAPITLDARTFSPGEKYRWFDGSQQALKSVNTPGSYWAEITFGNACKIRDTVQVLASQAFSVDLPPDTTLCTGDSLILRLPSNIIGVRSIWQDSTESLNYVVKRAGKYKVTATLSGCSVSDSIVVSFQSPPGIDLGRDTLLCAGATLILDAKVQGANNWQWSTGTTGQTLTVNTPGTYSVQVRSGFCTVRDTLMVSYRPVIRLDFGRDTTVCADVVLTLRTTETFDSYLWQDGSRNATFTVRNPGDYALTVTRSGCTVSGKMRVTHKPLPFFTLPATLSACQGKVVSIGQGTPITGATYRWNDGVTLPERNVTTSGRYELVVTLNGCTYKDDVVVTFDSVPALNLPPQTDACVGEVVTLDVSQPNATYFWSNGDLTPTLKVNKSGLVWVQVTIRGCLAIDSTFVQFNPKPSVAAGPDLLLCVGEAALVEAGSTPGSTLTWNNGDTGPKTTLLASGTYVVEAKLQGCTRTDTVVATFVDVQPQFLGVDRDICAGNSVRLEVQIPRATYQWQDGSTDAYFVANKSGIYHVTANVGSCRRIDSVTVRVNELPRFELGSDTTLCSGGTYTLRISAPSGSTYSWSNGSNTAALTVNQNGTYIGTATRNGCSWKDTAKVSFVPRIPVYLGLDTSLCDGQRLLLRATVSAEKYAWQDGSDGQQFLVEKPGWYSLSVSSGKCIFSDSIRVAYRKCIFYKIYAPNAFSPNGDGVNDVFKFALPPDVLVNNFQCTIFDRWGNILFQSNSISSGWDGLVGGNQANADSYVYSYIIEYTDENGPGRQVNGGTVLLLR